MRSMSNPHTTWRRFWQRAAVAVCFGAATLAGCRSESANETPPLSQAEQDRLRSDAAALNVELTEASMETALASDHSSLAPFSPDIHRIIDEGRNHNKVMTHLTYLTQEIGPRLTGSTRARLANEWAAEQFRTWGLSNVEVREWGTIPVGFDRGPSHGRMIEPTEREFEFTWRAWGATTSGPVRGPVVREPRSQEEFDAVKDKLAGAWVLQRARQQGERSGVRDGDPSGAHPTDWLDAVRAAGIAGVITPAGGEVVTTGGWGRRGSDSNWRSLTYEALPKDATVRIRRSDYDAINSRLADGEEVVVEFDLNAQWIDGPVPCYNTIAEIPGTLWADEVVIVCAHLDSWDGPGSQGTVDNGTGSSVTMEAARILAAAGVQPKRTIRFILWTGEEQGLLGSEAYVAALSEEERARISAVFVDDGGTNYEGGLNGLSAMQTMLMDAVAPVNAAFPDMTVAVKVVEDMTEDGGSDHASFNAVGIPAFFWDEVGRADYGYAWHTQHDKLDQAIPEYLVQSSTCSAVTAFNLANADTLLPRNLPQPPATAPDAPVVSSPGTAGSEAAAPASAATANP